MKGATQELLSMLKESNKSVIHKVIKSIKDEKIEEIYIVFTDLSGTLRGKCIDKTYFMNNIQNGFGFDYYVMTQTITDRMVEIYPIIPEISGDMIGIPDLKTFRKLPHSNKGIVILDLYWKNMKPILFYPRNKLKLLLKDYWKRKLIPKIGIELEFIILKDNKPICDLKKPYSMNSLLKIQNITDDISEYAREMGITLESISSEFEKGQYELVFKYGHVLELCDSFTFLKFILDSQLSNKHDISCSFVAKTSKNFLGNGLHFHQSLWSSKRNVFSDTHSNLFKHFLAGNIKHTKSLSLFYFPNPNSFTRLKKGSTAPTTITWGFDNRSVAFRIPERTKNKLRIENRLPGSDANIYMTQIAALTSGLIGIEMRYDLDRPCEFDAYTDTKLDSLPKTMKSALNEYEKDFVLRKKLGFDFDTVFLTIKKQEVLDFQKLNKL